jgi:hypothetical protein
MSTSAVINPSTTSATLPVKNEIVNFAVVYTLDAEGKIKKVRHTSSEKDITALQAEGYTGDESIAFLQAVTSYKVGTLEGFEQLIPDAEERLNIINKGIGSKFNQKIKTVLTEQDEAGNLAFQPVEPSYDALALLQEAALRTNLSPTDKAIKMLAGLPEEMRAAILAQFAAAGQYS